MKLENFGGILGFAAEIEAADAAFYKNLATNNDACMNVKEIFEQFAKDEKKNEKNMLRTRQQNVTEMILEAISDFNSDAFIADREGADTMDVKEAISKAIDIENKAEAFYLQAAEKLSALPEVARVLKKTASKRANHINRLKELG